MALKNNAGLTAAERVVLARMPQRPGVEEYVDALFENVFEQRGDRTASDDQAIMCAIATFHGRPVTVVGHRKGSTIEQRMAFNFGMPSPEGYRKAQRSMRAAEKFGRPIITFVDTPGAYPGLEAEEHGQGEAIARSIELMSALKVPVICVICGEGGSARWRLPWATGCLCSRTRFIRCFRQKVSPRFCGRTRLVRKRLARS